MKKQTENPMKKQTMESLLVPGLLHNGLNDGC